MPKLKFKNKNGIYIPVDEIQATYRFEDWDLPLPVLLMLAGDFDRKRNSDVGISELCGEIQPSILKLRHDRLVDPQDLAWATWGTAMHLGLYQALPPELMLKGEVYHQVEIEGLTVGARIDYIEDDTVWDYKSTSVYKAKRVVEHGIAKGAPDWLEQLTMYGAIVPNVRRFGLVVFCRDWQEKESGKYAYPKRVNAFRTNEEDWNLEFSKFLLTSKVADWKRAISLEDSELPECKDLWGSTIDGLPRRCAKYCDVRDSCKQFHRLMERRRS